MKSTLPMLACCVLASCTQPKYSMPWVPITDPAFKEVYGEHAPTVDAIFGGKNGLALLDKPDSVTLFALRPMNDDDQPDEITRLGFFAAVGSGTTLRPEDYRPLLAALQEPQNYGDEFLGVTSADFGFKIVSGTNVVDIVLDLETPSVTIARMEQQRDSRRAASLALVETACRIAQQYLKPATEYRRRIGRERSNKSVDHYVSPAEDGV